jgi:hypothetical protein
VNARAWVRVRGDCEDKGNGRCSCVSANVDTGVHKYMSEGECAGEREDDSGNKRRRGASVSVGENVWLSMREGESEHRAKCAGECEWGTQTASDIQTVWAMGGHWGS